MNSYPFVVLAHHILCTGLAVISLKFSTSVIFHRKYIYSNSKTLSPVLTFFFIFSFVFSAFTLLSKIFSIIFWRPSENIYNAHILFWIGFFPQYLGYIATALEVFLCIDRCLAILFPTKYSEMRHRQYSYLTAVALMIYGAGFLWLNNFFLFLPNSNSTTCLIFGCFLKALPWLMISRFVTVGMNVAGGLILFLLIRIKLNASTNQSLSKTVIVMIATSTFVEVFPTVTSAVVTNIYNVRANDIVGPYGTTFQMINMTFSVWLYSRAFRKTFKFSPSVHERKIADRNFIVTVV